MENVKVKIRDTVYIDLLDTPVEQAVPEIQVTENGLITATSRQEKGSVRGGVTKSNYQLPVEEGKEIIPSQETQKAIDKGSYAIGDIIVSPIVTQEKEIEITDDGTYVVAPENNKFLSKVMAKVDTSQKRQEAYEEGKKEFIDKYIDYGKRTDFNFAFAGVGWNDNNFKLNYPIQPTDAESMFYGAKITYLDLDFSRCKSLGTLLRNSSVVEVKEIDARALDASGAGLYWTFGYAPVVTIGLIKSNSTVLFNNTFYGCYDLKNITFDGEIGQNINFQWSTNLEHSSIISVITHLSDSSTSKTAYFSKSAVNKAFATGQATYVFNDDDTELLNFLSETNYDSFDFGFTSNRTHYENLVSSSEASMRYGDISAYNLNGWTNEAFKTITIDDTSNVPIRFMRYLIKMTTKTSNISSQENGSESPEWLDLVASKPNWTISLV